MPLPKSAALLATSPVLSASEAAVCEESGGAEIDAVFVFFIELGAGKVLTGLSKRIADDLTGISVQTPQDIEEFLKRAKS